MGLPSEPSFPHNVPLGAATGRQALCQQPAPSSYVALMPTPDPNAQGWELKAKYWPVPSYLVSPEASGLAGREKTQEGMFI